MDHADHVKRYWKTVNPDNKHYNSEGLTETQIALIANTLGFQSYMCGYHLGNIYAMIEPVLEKTAKLITALAKGFKHG